MLSVTMVEFTRQLLAGQTIEVDTWAASRRVMAMQRMRALFSELLEFSVDESQGRPIWTISRALPAAEMVEVASDNQEISHERP